MSDDPTPTFLPTAKVYRVRVDIEVVAVSHEDAAAAALRAWQEGETVKPNVLLESHRTPHPWMAHTAAAVVPPEPPPAEPRIRRVANPCRLYRWTKRCNTYSGAHVCRRPGGHTGSCFCAECGARGTGRDLAQTDPPKTSPEAP